MALPQYPYIEVEDYLTLDRNSAERSYEYFDGDLLMLAGGSTYHSMIIANLTIAIGRSLEGGPCQTYNSDIRLQLSESCYVHPDVSVSCDPRDQELDDMIRYPRLVVEVLSPSTEAVDKGKKLTYYLDHATIEEYVMADSQSIRIEVYHREEDGWRLRTYGPGSIVKLTSLGIQLPLDNIYRNMKLTDSRSNKKRRS